jgi:hypothetical protein
MTSVSVPFHDPASAFTSGLIQIAHDHYDGLPTLRKATVSSPVIIIGIFLSTQLCFLPVSYFATKCFSQL